MCVDRAAAGRCDVSRVGLIVALRFSVRAEMIAPAQAPTAACFPQMRLGVFGPRLAQAHARRAASRCHEQQDQRTDTERGKQHHKQ